MATGKWVKTGGVWKPVTNEYVKVGGTMKPVTTNYVKVGGSWKGIPFAKYLFVCEQFSDYLYGLDDTPTALWYHSAAAWDAGTTYGTGELAYYGAQTYRCILGHINQPPPNLTYWQVAVADPVDVACDNHGVTYWAAGNYVYKVALSGLILWDYDHGTSVLSVCVDAGGAVYTGDLAGTVRKFNASGALQWSKSLGANYAVYALAVDYSAGILYAGTGFTKDAVYRLLTINGNSTLAYTCPYGDVSGIGIDELSPTSLYISTNAGYLMKISTGGYVYWGSGGAIASAVYNVRVGHDGYGYCATGPSGGLYKFVLSTGGNVWHYIPGGTACAIGCAVDQFGNVYGSWYVAGTSVYNVVRKINSSGALVWSWQPYTGAQFRGIAVTPGAKAAGY